MKLLLCCWFLLLAACAHRPTPKSDQSLYNSHSIERPSSSQPIQKLKWPLAKVKVSAYFGWRRRKLHEGIDLQAKNGTEVWSAGSGEVIYVGRRLRGFGLMIVIDHGHDVSTVYAHLNKSFVAQGARIQTGQVIALSGRSGRVTGPHLHFEVRVGSDPVDPLVYLPSLNALQN